MDKTDKILLACCLILGAILRCYHPDGLPFINDELGALNRIEVGSFSSLISEAVWNDTHPAFTHVLLYFWTGLFGTSELAVKLPFILMSIASIYAVFKITQQWFSTNAALYTTALFSTLQFGVLYAPIARPYSSGLFFILWMVLAWNKLVLDTTVSTKKHWISFILAGTLCLYNHYFTAISAALVGLTGFFFLPKTQWKNYSLAGLGIFLLYAPHLSITYHHIFEVGGVAWYGKPTWNFPVEHFEWMFHYSTWVMISVLLTIVFSGWGNRELFNHSKNKLRVVALSWFAIPLLFGLWYSIEKSPILRTSHLLFSYPFVLIFISSFIAEKTKNWRKAIYTCTLLLVITASLIYERAHFRTVYNYPYKEFVKTCQAFLAEHKPDEVTIVFGENPDFTQRYMELLDADFDYWKFGKQPLSPQEFKEYLAQEGKPYLIFGALPVVYQQIAFEQYRFINKCHYGINYELYIAAQEQNDPPNAFTVDLWKTTLDFWKDDTIQLAHFPWRYNEHWVIADSLTPNEPYLQIPTGTEWGPTLAGNSIKWINQVNEIVDLSINVRGENPSGKLVFALTKGEENLFWQAVDVSDFNPQPNQWTRVYQSIRIAHVIRERSELEGVELKVYFWNENKEAIALDKFVVQARRGNPILYGDLRKINPK